MVHQGQGLALGLEASQHRLGFQAGFDDLEGDLAADRLGLLGQVDDAHAAFADLLQELVGADQGAGALARPSRGDGLSQTWGRSVEWPLGVLVCGQQLADPLEQLGLAGAGLVEEGVSFLGCGLVQGGQEHSFGIIVRLGHGGSPRVVYPLTMRNPAANHPSGPADFR
jgi:hypothetical protein